MTEVPDQEIAARPEAGEDPTTAEAAGRKGLVLVTGGNRGLGRAIVEALVEVGYRVAFTYRTGEEEARKLERVLNGRATAYPMDLSDRRRPKELVIQLETEEPIVALVNNAGIQSSSLLAMTSDADWDRMIDVNLSGAFRCCRAVLPMMVRRRRGAIVNVASLGAERGIAGQSGYAASKAGLLAMTRVLAKEMGKRKIRVNAVVPGFVETGMTENLPAAAKAGLRSAECLPGGTTAAAVAQAVVFLISDLASGVTGESLHVDAGASC